MAIILDNYLIPGTREQEECSSKLLAANGPKVHILIKKFVVLCLKRNNNLWPRTRYVFRRAREDE